MPNIISVFIPVQASADDKEKAQSIAEKWSLPWVTVCPDSVYVTVDSGIVQIKDASAPKQQGVYVDFLSAQLSYRKEKGGGIKEPLARAFGLKASEPQTIIDATPGLGRDAFVMASVGANVIMVERNPVVAVLLADGLARLQYAGHELATRLHLIASDSREYLAEYTGEDIDGVYLDPMFPHRKKSALVKKEMRTFQQFLGFDEDAGELLTPALQLVKKRVVVKRPNGAEVLSGKPPSMAIESKKHRFDVYIKHYC